MVFSSLFFLYLFLPLNLLIYFFAKNIKARNIVMLIFSLVFYAWGEPLYVLLLVFMAVCDWLISLFIQKQKPHGKLAKLGLCMMAVVNLGLLGFFKYGSFVLENIGLITGHSFDIVDIALPIGISFYTFQLISYVIDVYRGDVPAQKNFATLIL